MDQDGRSLLSGLAPFSARNEIEPERLSRDSSVLRRWRGVVAPFSSWSFLVIPGLSRFGPVLTRDVARSRACKETLDCCSLPATVEEARDARTVSTAFRRLREAGELHQIQLWSAAHEVVCSREGQG